MPIGLFLAAVVLYGLFNLPGFIEQKIFEARIEEKFHTQNELFLKDITWFEWDKVCRQDGYMDGSTSPYVWELVFMKGDRSEYYFEFYESKYGDGLYENEKTDWCVEKNKARILKRNEGFILSR